MRLLVVDDNDEITQAITFYCSTEKDLDCRVINNGQEGLESIRSEKFDLILLDIAMPEFSGGGCNRITQTRPTYRIKEHCYLYGFIESKSVR